MVILHTMTNPELDQDRAFDLYDTYRKYGYVMFPQQRRIYEQIANGVIGATVLEAGCGNGVGSVILAHVAAGFVGTDKLQGNINFTRQLYPHLNFQVWDMQDPPIYQSKFDVVVAVECIEHVADPIKAIKNLCESARDTVWISTPNGNGADRPPSNPYHVCEYTPQEMVDMIGSEHISILAWDDFRRELGVTTDVNPLVYRIDL